MASNHQLRVLENLMQPSSIESVKKNIFNQNMYTPVPSFLERIDLAGYEDFSDTLEFKVCKKAYDMIIENLAQENGMHEQDVIIKLVEIMEFL